MASQVRYSQVDAPLSSEARLSYLPRIPYLISLIALLSPSNPPDSEANGQTRSRISDNHGQTHIATAVSIHPRSHVWWLASHKQQRPSSRYPDSEIQCGGESTLAKAHVRPHYHYAQRYHQSRKQLSRPGILLFDKTGLLSQFDQDSARESRPRSNTFGVYQGSRIHWNKTRLQ